MSTPSVGSIPAVDGDWGPKVHSSLFWEHNFEDKGQLREYCSGSFLSECVLGSNALFLHWNTERDKEVPASMAHTGGQSSPG
jgi:hypothetical protein